MDRVTDMVPKVNTHCSTDVRACERLLVGQVAKCLSRTLKICAAMFVKRRHLEHSSTTRFNPGYVNVNAINVILFQGRWFLRQIGTVSQFLNLPSETSSTLTYRRVNVCMWQDDYRMERWKMKWGVQGPQHQLLQTILCCFDLVTK